MSESIQAQLGPYKERFNSADDLPKPQRTLELSAIMTELELDFRIPILNNEHFNQSNKEIMELYKNISMARDL